jgi:predicted nucleotidyltransferase
MMMTMEQRMNYDEADWRNQAEYRRAGLELVRQNEKIVSLQKHKAERRGKLRNNIDAIKQSGATCRSALMQ